MAFRWNYEFYNYMSPDKLKPVERPELEEMEALGITPELRDRCVGYLAEFQRCMISRTQIKHTFNHKGVAEWCSPYYHTWFYCYSIQ